MRRTDDHDQDRSGAGVATHVRRRLLTGDDAIVDELCSADLVEHQFGLAGAGAAAIAHVKAAMRDVHGMAPDLQFTIEDTVEADDVIWVRARGRGTATGPFFGPAAGGRWTSP